MSRWIPRLQGAVIIAAIAAAAWLHLSPPARECAERGGQYYLDGSCGVFTWTPH